MGTLPGQEEGASLETHWRKRNPQSPGPTPHRTQGHQRTGSDSALLDNRLAPLSHSVATSPRLKYETIRTISPWTRACKDSRSQPTPTTVPTTTVLPVKSARRRMNQWRQLFQTCLNNRDWCCHLCQIERNNHNHNNRTIYLNLMLVVNFCYMSHLATTRGQWVIIDNIRTIRHLWLIIIISNNNIVRRNNTMQCNSNMVVHYK